MNGDAASWLRAWRARMGWRQDVAAAELHVSPFTYASYENRRRTVPERALELARRIEADWSGRFVPRAAESDVHVVGGGTRSYVRRNLVLENPAAGTTARALAEILARRGRPAVLHLTRVADPVSPVETNADLAALADRIAADRRVRTVFFNASPVDFDGVVDGVPSGRGAPRLRSRDGVRPMVLSPAARIVGRLRCLRPDLFVVAFRGSSGASADEQHRLAEELIREADVNLVLANDDTTRLNLIVERTGMRLLRTSDRAKALELLADLALSLTDAFRPEGAA